jgi:N-acetylglucosaminyldiphosphoundecaprenol N-acetyl-beta-D-mannosaminyltransferase
LGLTLSALCLWLAFRDVSLPALLDALSLARWEWAALAVTIVVANTLFKAARWRALFLPRRVSLRSLWGIFLIGQMLNAVLPARAGEVGRIYYAGETGAVSRAAALSTVVAEKVADLVMLALAYLIVARWLTTRPAGIPAWLRDAGAGLLPLAALALGGLLLFAYAGRWLWQVLRPGLRFLPGRWREKADRAAGQALDAFRVFRDVRVSAMLWGLSLSIWLLMALINGLMFRAFDLPLPPGAALLLLVVLMSGVAVPPLPGSLGVFPYLCVLVLSLFDVSRERSLAYGLALQAVAYAPLILLGTVSLLRQHWRARRSPSPPGEAGRGTLPEAGSNPKPVCILGVRVHVLTLRGLLGRIVSVLESDTRARVMYANVHTLSTAHRDEDLRHILNRAEVVYCDGAGVRLGARLLGGHLPQRMTGADWIHDLCALCQDRGFSLYFLGGRPGVAGIAAEHLRAKYPALQILGVQHGHYPHRGPENARVLAAINALRPDILLVGFGTPLQERWIDRNFAHLRVPVVWALGALVDFVSGQVPRAPRWMRRAGLEWLFRLLTEPRRLWRRYLVSNPLFVMRVLRQALIAQESPPDG